MRKLTAGLFQSVDGVVESPDRWQFDHFDEELGAALGTMISTVDTVIMGRVGYEEWSGYWPNATQDEGFADFINPVEKFVASRTLSGPLEWQNAKLIDGGLEDFVSTLKDTDGGEISVCASISVVRQLLTAGLLDELTLMIHPVMAGSGRHLFEADHPVTRLELRDLQRTSSGNTVVRYAPRGT